MGKLVNKVTLVTGSGRGFGRAIALAFANEGAQVVSVARPSPQDLVELQSLEKAIENQGGVVLTVPTDLTKEVEIQHLKDKVLERFGRCDVLVNNAGVSLWKTIDALTVNDWDVSVGVNLRAPFILAKKFFKVMKNQGGGSIINISSRAAEIGFFAELELCPSKFAIEGMTQCLALELKQYNIAANSLHPSAPPGKRLKPTGLTLSEANELPKEVTNQYAKDEEMVTSFGDAWTFLASQDGAGVTGQRFRLHELAEFLRKHGWEAAVNKWKGKLMEAVYTPYEWPKKIRYQTPGGGYNELEFD